MTAATPEQLAALTLPATLPGVVRVGTPLAGSCVAVSAVHEDDAGFLYCMVARDPMESHGAINPEPLCDLHINLTDATGRAHVAWAVAAAAKHWPSEPDYTTATWRAYLGGIVTAVGLSSGHWWPWTHHALAHLNPDDDTSLPDNSRWVDAEALRLVALHVLGGGK